ncbi:MAG: phage shock protein PspC [Crocinitomicaceae bacterium]|jgi:phage shock protein PspC (stress-responsive transcriptional regulator)|nr:phage shock protein PspC [Crocinitomicaceae bacterium]
MKKTVSVNIKGLNFMIEEDAYELLHHYMLRLENSFAGQKGGKDIVEDIELRIAELCQGYLSEKKQVIEKEDIEAIIAALGQPEDFLDEEEAADAQNRAYTQQQQSVPKDKRLYRDVENAKIAGVCAGLSNYFNIDVIVVRVIFLVFLFFGGFGFPLYVILWIVIPKASSSIDRLRMQGKPITVDSVKEEIGQATDRLTSSSKSFADKLRKDDNLTRRFSSIGRLITSVFGLGLIVTGVFFLVIFLVLFFGGLRFIPIHGENGFLSFSELGELLLSDSGDVFLWWLGTFLVVFSVILFMLSNGTYLLLRLKSRWAKISSLSLVGLGIIGTVLCIYLGTKSAGDVVSEAEVVKKIASLNAPELVIESLEGDPGVDGFARHGNGGFNPILVKGNRIYDHGIKFLYRPSKDSLYHIYQNMGANGFSYRNATAKARNIEHKIQLDSNVLHIDPEFSFPKKDKIRGQEVFIIIEIPHNKWVKIDDERISVDEPAAYDEEEKMGYMQHNGEYERWD